MRTWPEQRAWQHRRGEMGDEPLFEAVGGGAWSESRVLLVWVQVGLEIQGNSLKSVSISCFQCQGPSKLQCTRQGEAGWEGQGPAEGKCL